MPAALEDAKKTEPSPSGAEGASSCHTLEKLAQVLPIPLPPGCFIESDGGDGVKLEGVGGGDTEVATSTPA